MKEYKHIFDALAAGNVVEVRNVGAWVYCDPKLVLVNISHGTKADEFRIKPKNININGHEVHEPVREPPQHESAYFVADITDAEQHSVHWWVGDQLDNLWLSRGIVHLTKESAIAHAKALLSFTKLPDPKT